MINSTSNFIFIQQAIDQIVKFNPINIGNVNKCPLPSDFSTVYPEILVIVDYATYE